MLFEILFILLLFVPVILSYVNIWLSLLPSSLLLIIWLIIKSTVKKTNEDGFIQRFVKLPLFLLIIHIILSLLLFVIVQKENLNF